MIWNKERYNRVEGVGQDEAFLAIAQKIGFQN
jgi:hypothetical protein